MSKSVLLAGKLLKRLFGWYIGIGGQKKKTKTPRKKASTRKY